MRYFETKDNNGNMYEIKKILQASARGEHKKISFLGASVSNGEFVKRDKGFVSLLEQQWQEHFKTETKPEFINYSKSGTLSANAIFSMWDLLERKPDLVFLDYAANDIGQDYLYETIESVAYNFLKHGTYVVILLFCNNNRHSCRGGMVRSAKHYNFPIIDIGKIIFDNIDEGEFTWDDLALDYVHPNEKGHQFIADNLFRFFDECLKAEKEAFKLRTDPCHYGIFNDIQIIDNLEFHNGYEYEGEFTDLLVEYTQHPEPSCCSFEVYLDGVYQKTIDRYNDWSWDNRVADYFSCEDEEKSRHKLELRPAKNFKLEDGELNEFHVKLGLGKYVEN